MRRRLACLLSLALLIFGQPFAVRALACAVRACPMAVTAAPRTSIALADLVPVLETSDAHRCCRRPVASSLATISAVESAVTCCCEVALSTVEYGTPDVLHATRSSDCSDDESDFDPAIAVQAPPRIVASARDSHAVLAAGDSSPPRDPYAVQPPCRAPPVLTSLRSS